jgi:hypothetical protein
MESKHGTTERIDLTQAKEVTVIDSDEDEVAAEAIGGTNADLPPGYYRSPSFIGTIVVRRVSYPLWIALILTSYTLVGSMPRQLLNLSRLRAASKYPHDHQSRYWFVTS